MLTDRVFKKILITTKRAALAAAVSGIGITSASADVVDLATTTIDRHGKPVQQAQPGGVRQVQAQEAVPAPQPEPLQPPGEPPAAPAPQDQLNVDPNADIDDIAPPPQAPPTPPPPSTDFGGDRRGGATFGSFSSAPTILGDFQGGGLAQLSGTAIQTFGEHARGFYVSGLPGEQNAIIAFESGGDIVPNDAFTTGPGTNAAGPDGSIPQFDTFSILEPIPPSDLPTSPGPGFTFNGGNAVFTRTSGQTTAQPGIINDGEQWFLNYSYSANIGVPGTDPVIPVPGPGVSVRRVKIAENFSPEVRDRYFLNYSFFNDAFGGLGDISRYVGGFEKVLVDRLISIEARFPFAGTFGSTQTLGTRQNRSLEFGNASIIGKGVLLRTDKLVWTGGLGIGLPLADDTVLRSQGRDIVRIENESVFLQPFMGLLLRKSRDTTFQGYMQLDVTANGDPVFANLAGGSSLPQVGVFNDSTLLHVDIAASHSVYRNRCAKVLREILANAELHYTGTVQDADFVEGNNFTYTNLKRNFTIVNATFGMHMVMSNNLVVSPAMAVPLRSGLDEQFDYEAIVQLNYFR